MADLTITTEEYEALLYFARLGANASGQFQPMSDKVRDIDKFAKNIESRNGINRYAVWVRWQELDAPLPATTDFPNTWPPLLQAFIEQTERPIARPDVDRVLASKAQNPQLVMVTKDVGAVYGWTKIEDFFL